MRSNFIKEDSNWLYFVLALCVSLILWYTVNAREQIERVVDVRLDYKGLPQGLVVLNGQLNKIQVRLRGPRELFRTMESKELSHVVDLTTLVKGINVLPLDRSGNHGFRMYQMLEISPPHLTLEVDTLGSREVPVAMRVRNPSALEKDVTVKWLSAAPGTVTLKGPESVLATINTLTVDAPIGAYTEGNPQVIEAPVLAPMNVEARPNSVTAEFVVNIKRRSVTMLRQLTVESRGDQCVPHPPRVRLRVGVPEHRATEDGYLDQVQAVINATDQDGHGAAELPIQVHLPADARLESIAPAMARVRCE